MTTTIQLAADLAERYDVDPAVARVAVERAADDLGGEHYDYPTAEILTDEGEERVVQLFRADFDSEYIAAAVANAKPLTLEDQREHLRRETKRIREARKDVERLMRYRDEGIREALKMGASVPDLMEDTGCSRARIYQVRDGRR